MEQSSSVNGRNIELPYYEGYTTPLLPCWPKVRARSGYRPTVSLRSEQRVGGRRQVLDRTGLDAIPLDRCLNTYMSDSG